MSRIANTMKRKRLGAASLGFPLFVGSFGGFFRGAIPGTPTGIANMTSGYGQLTVTGTSGATTLTVVSADVAALADYAGEWACLVNYNDGTQLVHTAVNLNTGNSTIDVYPTLASAVTAKALPNLFSSANGQHLTQQGFNALGRYVAGLKKRDGWLRRMANRLTFTPGGMAFGDAMALTGGLTTGSVVAGTSIAKGLFSPTTLNMQAAPANAVVYTGSDRSYLASTGVKSVIINAGTAGQGATHTANLGGRSGTMETFVGVCGQVSGTEASKARVKVTIDSVDIVNQLVAGLTRITCPYTAATTGVLSVTVETSNPTCIRLGPIHWGVWGTDWGSADPAGALFDSGSRVALLCDSWGVQGTNAFQAGIEAVTGTPLVVNASVSGQTAAWGIANYDTLVEPYKPDFVIMDFLINDQTGGLKGQEWVNDVRALSNLILSRGAVPVWLRSLQTASLSQSQTLIGYSNHLTTVFPSVG